MFALLLFVLCTQATYIVEFNTKNVTIDSDVCKNQDDSLQYNDLVMNNNVVRIDDYDYGLNYNANKLIELHFANTSYTKNGIIIATIINDIVYDIQNNKSSNISLQSNAYYVYTNNTLLQKLIVMQVAMYVNQFDKINSCPKSISEWQYFIWIGVPILCVLLVIALFFAFVDTKCDCNPTVTIHIRK